MKNCSTDVLIVGAGPTGLFLSNLLASHDIKNILIEKNSVDVKNKKTKIITKGRHDPCVGIRAVPIAEAMMAIILVDQIMMHEAQIGTLTK